MIGVSASELQHPAVREFFELFKTPWEFFRENRPYTALICSHSIVPETSAPLIIVSREGEAETEAGTARQKIVHLGFDLFAEVELLLTQGQPSSRAHLPTLDSHIETLRDLLREHGIAFVEIPPVPAGHDFIACLTHDVDHPRIRHHFCDHTMFGFLYRALIASWGDLARGRKTFRQVLKNYQAVLTLPFVYLGLVPDFWNQFDHYREIEGEIPSTFFVIPHKGVPGLDASGHKRRKRAARYSLLAIADALQRLMRLRCEVATHGIDAWRNSEEGRAELKAVQAATKIRSKEIGIRMHWLFFQDTSPQYLEAAGYSYDATLGYNDTIGYCAGTTQAFKPLKVERLLELPLHIMDTAMFYPSYMGLSARAAIGKMGELINHTAQFGGVLTINWHDRSLAPERQWDGPYIELVKELKRRRAWMPVASDAVAWFRARRAAEIKVEDDTVAVTTDELDEELPGLCLRTHHPVPRHRFGSNKGEFTDVFFRSSASFPFTSSAAVVSAA